jgi:lipoate---protein ligase
MQPIRLLNLGQVSPVRSQTIYHAVGYTLGPDTPDTIIFVNSHHPYVSIGFHQVAESEVDLETCASLGLPVVRREVGGGAVYLDHNQIFVQWVFHANHLPAVLEERFAVYVKPLLDTYHALGIPAQLRPINDIHVNNKKIGGTGAARMGQAEIVVGSLMIDFDKATMARVLKVPSEKMRDKIFASLEQYMTTIREQLGSAPDPQTLADLYVEKCSAALGREILPGSLSAEEEAKAVELDALFASDEWLYMKGGLRGASVKIREGVRVSEAAYKAPGGLIRATVCVSEGCIEDLSLSGDFTLLPIARLVDLEAGLRGAPAQPEALAGLIAGLYQSLQIQSPGVQPEDFTRAVAAALEG